MIKYYFELALRSFRRSPGLTALMLLTIAIGVGACMTTLTVFHVLSGDPIPQKSEKLFNIQLDAFSLRGYKPGDEPPLQLTRYDAETLIREARADRQLMMTAGSVAVEMDGQKPTFTTARYSTADFFAMFDVPVRLGRTWNAADDKAAARVVVISDKLNEQLFGGGNPVGKIVRIREKDLTIIGVLGKWRPVPTFYDMTIGAYRNTEDVFVPFTTAMDLKFGSMGNFNCWAEHAPSTSRDSGAPCAWLQYWAELGTPEKARAYHQYLKDYSELQRKAGRFERPTNVGFYKVMDWLAHQEVVPSDIKLQLWLAFGFLTVCLVNTVGLLLAKCLRRSGEIGVRRALGAPRRQIFLQFLVEAGSLGLAGGLLGLLLTGLGLWAVRNGSADYAGMIELDTVMLMTTLGLALLASLAAGLLPAWRATQVTPALQLKTQ